MCRICKVEMKYIPDIQCLLWSVQCSWFSGASNQSDYLRTFRMGVLWYFSGDRRRAIKLFGFCVSQTFCLPFRSGILPFARGLDFLFCVSLSLKRQFLAFILFSTHLHSLLGCSSLSSATYHACHGVFWHVGTDARWLAPHTSLDVFILVLDSSCCAMLPSV